MSIPRLHFRLFVYFLPFVLIVTACRKDDSPSGLPYKSYVSCSAVHVTDTSATIICKVDSPFHVHIFERGVCVSEEPFPDIHDLHASSSLPEGNFTLSVTGLQPYTAYFARGYLKTGTGYHYGEQAQFTTFLSTPRLQVGFVLDYTSTICPYCGSWGIPLKEELMKMGIVSSVSLHGGSDPFSNPGFKFYTDRPNDGFYPTFWVGDKRPEGIPAIRTAMQNLLIMVPAASIGISARKDGPAIDATCHFKFFEPAPSDYFVSYYLMEDSIPQVKGYLQQGLPPNSADFRHISVLRAFAGQDVFGDLLIQSPLKDTVVAGQVSFAADAQWNNKLFVIAILWRYDPVATPHYRYVNSVRSPYLP